MASWDLRVNLKCCLMRLSIEKILLILVLSACSGKLTDEQRKRLHEGMATQDIRRVTDVELQQAAMDSGKNVMDAVVRLDVSLKQKSKIDSLASAHKVRIIALTPSGVGLSEIEKQLVEAYVTSGVASQPDNLQKLGDSLLYTRPVFKKGADGTQQFDYAIGIKMSTKVLVLSLPQK